MKAHMAENDDYNIIDAKSLHLEILKVRERIKIREIELKTLTGKLPREAIKYSAALFLPGFLTTKIAGSSVSGVWNIVKIASGQKKAIFPLIASLIKTVLWVFLKKKLKIIGFNNATHNK